MAPDAINAVPATLPNAVLMKRKGIDSVISAATVNENSMISREKLPNYLAFFQFVHNTRKRGKVLLQSLVERLLA